ncbi:MAG: Hpt domain-containing protein [Propionivibrio sp.]
MEWLLTAAADAQRDPGAPFATTAPALADRKPSPDSLPAIDGLDSQRGLALLRGDMSTYMRLLRQFAAGHVDDGEQLAAELADGQLDAVRQRAHALKGAAGALGATRLQTIAATVEAALRKGKGVPDLAALVQALRAELEALCEALAGLPSPLGAEAEAVADPARAQVLLEQLEPLLATDDTTAGELFDANRSLLLASLGAAAAGLKRQIEGFDYPGALATVRKLMRHRPEG